MDFKQYSHGIKELDETKGEVSAYANAYNNEDYAGDISAFGSFTKTVSENMKRIRVLKDHDTRISLGVPLIIDTNDSYGLNTVTKFNLKKEVSRDMFSDIQLMKENGLNAELSIGYDVIKRDGENQKVIKEYRLWEYSFLTSWACNQLAVVGDIKSLQDMSGIMSLISKSYNLPYSDGRLRKIEELLKSLTNKPSEDTIEPSEIEAIKKQILLTYKNSI